MPPCFTATPAALTFVPCFPFILTWRSATTMQGWEMPFCLPQTGFEFCPRVQRLSELEVSSCPACRLLSSLFLCVCGSSSSIIIFARLSRAHVYIPPPAAYFLPSPWALRFRLHRLCFSRLALDASTALDACSFLHLCFLILCSPCPSPCPFPTTF